MILYIKGCTSGEKIEDMIRVILRVKGERVGEGERGGEHLGES